MQLLGLLQGVRLGWSLEAWTAKPWVWLQQDVRYVNSSMQSSAGSLSGSTVQCEPGCACKSCCWKQSSPAASTWSTVHHFDLPATALA